MMRVAVGFVAIKHHSKPKGTIAFTIAAVQFVVIPNQGMGLYVNRDCGVFTYSSDELASSFHPQDHSASMAGSRSFGGLVINSMATATKPMIARTMNANR